MKHVSLSRLVRPTGVDTFVRDVWGRAVRVYPRSLGRGADKILSLEDFEVMLATLNRADHGWLHFARGGLRQVPRDMLDQDGMLNLRRMRAAFASGETLYLTKAERLSSSLMHLCRAVELDLAARGIVLRQSVNAHVFLTPPGAQGFPPHRDEHASFVVQLEGGKQWTVYEPGPESPAAAREVPRPGVVEASSLGRLKMHRHDLQAGDVLYMPEWWPHEARASTSHSLHVTLRIFPLRWVDVIVELYTDHPALAGAIPLELATRPGGLAEPLVAMLGSPAFVTSLPGLLDGIVRRRAVPRTALPDGGLRQVLGVDQLTVDTLLVRSSGTSCAVFAAGDEVCIGFPGGMIRGPAAIKDVFEYVAKATALRARDLPAIAGRHYDRLDVVRTMVREGLLRIARDDPQAPTRAAHE